MSNQVRVIITDNSVEFVDLFKSRLELYEDIKIVGVAYNGNQTINILKNRQDVDVLLLDIVMPEMDGLELLGKIKEINPRPAVIVVSALGTDTIVSRALCLGAYSYFNKPFDCDKLANAIYSAFDSRIA